MERRRSQRVPIQVWVEQWTDRELYHQLSANLSRGGIFLDRTVPLPEGTLVNLRFHLPGRESPLEVRGRIAFPKSDDDSPGMGVEFVQLDAEVAQIIDAFLVEHEVAEEGTAAEASEDPPEPTPK